MNARRAVPVFALVLLVVGIAGAPRRAAAEFTPLGDELTPPISSPGEDSLYDILDHVYGVGNYERIADYGAVNDQLWTWSGPAGFGIATPIAKKAAYHFEFGVIAANRGGHDTFKKAFNDAGIKWDSPHSYSFASPHGEPFRLGLNVKDTKLMWSSLAADNSDSTADLLADHMVTLRITGNAGADFAGNPIGNFVVGWEDISFKLQPDFDYQDLIVELSGVQPAGWEPDYSLSGGGGIGGSMAMIPEPVTVVLLGTLGFGAVVYQRRSLRACA